MLIAERSETSASKRRLFGIYALLAALELELWFVLTIGYQWIIDLPGTPKFTSFRILMTNFLRALNYWGGPVAALTAAVLFLVSPPCGVKDKLRTGLAVLACLAAICFLGGHVIQYVKPQSKSLLLDYWLWPSLIRINPLYEINQASQFVWLLSLIIVLRKDAIALNFRIPERGSSLLVVVGILLLAGHGLLLLLGDLANNWMFLPPWPVALISDLIWGVGVLWENHLRWGGFVPIALWAFILICDYYLLFSGNQGPFRDDRLETEENLSLEQDGSGKLPIFFHRGAALLASALILALVRRIVMTNNALFPHLRDDSYWFREGMMWGAWIAALAGVYGLTKPFSSLSRTFDRRMTRFLGLTGLVLMTPPVQVNLPTFENTFYGLWMVRQLGAWLAIISMIFLGRYLSTIVRRTDYSEGLVKAFPRAGWWGVGIYGAWLIFLFAHSVQIFYFPAVDGYTNARDLLFIASTFLFVPILFLTVWWIMLLLKVRRLLTAGR